MQVKNVNHQLGKNLPVVQKHLSWLSMFGLELVQAATEDNRMS